MSKVARRKGSGTLEVHGRTFRAHYYKLDPRDPSGFARVTEGTGIAADGSDPEDALTDEEKLTLQPGKLTLEEAEARARRAKARGRAELWLEVRSAPYRHFIEHGRFAEDVAKLQRVAKGELAKTEGKLQQAATDLAQATDKLPAYTLEQAWDAFNGDRESTKRDPATHRNYRQWFHMLVKWLAQEHPETTELRGITSQIARDYSKHLLGKVRGTTHNRHLNALTLIWATLSARDPDGTPRYPEARLGGNPFAYDSATKSGIPRVKLVKTDRPHKRRDLQLEEIANLLKTATGEMQTLLATGFYTGLRLGDCCTLRVEHFDRALGVIRRRSGKTDEETETAIHPRLAQVLGANVTASKGYILPELAELYTADAYARQVREEYEKRRAEREAELEENVKGLDARQAAKVRSEHEKLEEERSADVEDLITNRRTTGRVEITRRLGALFRACGIETSYKLEGDSRARPDCGFHSLRHAYAVQLKRANVSLSQRQAALGHATSAMTLYYSDHPEAGAALALPDVLDAQALKKARRSASRTALPFIPPATADAAGDALTRACGIADGMTAEELRKLVSYVNAKLERAEEVQA